MGLLWTFLFNFPMLDIKNAWVCARAVSAVNIS
ncbi:hypothetical protein W822_04225 [Advenella kashmirensis W13003]|uniref:Uncharacterized protein n=1 Tax=Advenella kashmirensis W13003 TaxID=1424334 RepID=V8QYK3_9BURK|nr:hypothetical protein W822_04225 [Advenella kashmirensis W13003]